MAVRIIKALALSLFALSAHPGMARDCKLTVYFGLDQDDLSPDMQYVLATFVANNPRAYGSVIGHTDALASQAYNMDLSKRRAMTVINFIEQFKSNSVSLATDWQGKMNLAVNAPGSEPLNRRVEVYYRNCAPLGRMPAVLQDHVSPESAPEHTRPSRESSAASAGSGMTSASSSSATGAAAATAGNGEASTSASGKDWAASASAGPEGASTSVSGPGGASAATAGGGTTAVSVSGTGG
ncbi:OmpA family protein [Rhodobacter sp. KR11]|uniref:OmpA family protein n=1 Tax=Rhodobacter sp. KR11 TaxID=2974588 RepID=UPI002221A5E5|nr:OmpA family protein [Rhodobacter sp. KR11]MCW1920543.1 OmpA family protein [Rhodobacter sp. KR11]